MALNTRPVLSYISAFDAEFGTPSKENVAAPILKFGWKDGVVYKNRVVIREYDGNKIVYDCTVETMALKHQLHNQYDTSEKVQVVTYGLVNGKKYVANVYVCTSDGEWSLASNDVIFYCYSTPTFEFRNFNIYLENDTDVAVVGNSSVNLVVYYYQDNEEPLNSYKFELFDYTGKLLDESVVKYSALSEDKLRYTFGGIAETEKNALGSIKENREYKVVCSGETQHGIVVRVEQKFIVKLVSSGVGALVYAENIGNGAVSIYSNYKIINANCSLENPIYVKDASGKEYAIDLSNGGYVEFIDGFTMQEPYEVIIKGEFKIGKLLTLQGKKQISEEKCEYDYGYIYLKTIDYTTFKWHYFSFILDKNGIEYEIRSDYFRYDADLVKATVDLSYYNGMYNLNAKIEYENEYIVLDNYKDDVFVETLSESNVTDDNEGNVVFTSDIQVLDDDAGNITMLY